MEMYFCGANQSDHDYLYGTWGYFGHLLQNADSLEKTLMLGKIEGRRRGRQRMSWLEGSTSSIYMCFNKLWEIVKDREA